MKGQLASPQSFLSIGFIGVGLLMLVVLIGFVENTTNGTPSTITFNSTTPDLESDETIVLLNTFPTNNTIIQTTEDLTFEGLSSGSDYTSRIVSDVVSVKARAECVPAINKTYAINFFDTPSGSSLHSQNAIAVTSECVGNELRNSGFETVRSNNASLPLDWFSTDLGFFDEDGDQTVWNLEDMFLTTDAHTGTSALLYNLSSGSGLESAFKPNTTMAIDNTTNYTLIFYMKPNVGAGQARNGVVFTLDAINDAQDQFETFEIGFNGTDFQTISSTCNLGACSLSNPAGVVITDDVKPGWKKVTWTFAEGITANVTQIFFRAGRQFFPYITGEIIFDDFYFGKIDGLGTVSDVDFTIVGAPASSTTFFNLTDSVSGSTTFRFANSNIDSTISWYGNGVQNTSRDLTFTMLSSGSIFEYRQTPLIPFVTEPETVSSLIALITFGLLTVGIVIGIANLFTRKKDNNMPISLQEAINWKNRYQKKNNIM